MVILHAVTVSIFYDEKVNINKREALNKLRGGRTILGKINVYSVVLNTEKYTSGW